MVCAPSYDRCRFLESVVKLFGLKLEALPETILSFLLKMTFIL